MPFAWLPPLHCLFESKGQKPLGKFGKFIAASGFQEKGTLPELPLTAVQGFYKHWKEADLPINRDQVLFFPGPGEDEVLVNMTRVQGFDGTKVEDLTEAEEIGRKQVLMVADFMTKRLPGFGKASISQVGAQIGIRETRRLDGVYSLQIDDVTSGRRFDDVIARSGYPIDIHDPKNKGVTAAWIAGDGALRHPLPLPAAEADSELACRRTVHLHYA
ncbi:FAD-dependent oxidoreductase [Paenibacillus allorhizosphaerae]